MCQTVVFCPKLMAGVFDEHILQGRLAERDAGDVLGETRPPNPVTVRGPVRLFDPKRFTHGLDSNVEPGLDFLGQLRGRIFAMNRQAIAAHGGFEDFRGESIATNRPSSKIPNRSQCSASSIRCVVTKIVISVPRFQSLDKYSQRSILARRVQAGAGFIQQQHARLMQQALRDFHAAFQSARKRFDQIVLPVGQMQLIEQLRDARFQGFPTDKPYKCP